MLSLSSFAEHGEHQGPRYARDWGRLAPHEEDRDADMLRGRVGEDMGPVRKEELRQPHMPIGENTLAAANIPMLPCALFVA